MRAKEFLKPFKSYSHSGVGFPRDDYKGFKSWQAQAPAGKYAAPHEDREYPMMVAGVKPAALPNNDYYEKYFKDDVAAGKFIAMDDGHGSKIVGLPGEEKRLHAIRKLLDHNFTDIDLDYHIKLGRLLGYPMKYIEEFTKDRT